MVNIPRTNIDPFARYQREKIVITIIKGYTIITNLDSIAHSLNRTSKDIISFLASNLGTRGSENKLRGSNFTVAQLEDKLEVYIINNVLCKTCGNPETHVEKSKLRCLACGY
jgi:translation initiation factor 2 beta subunit (eIF-2beta)/eIF-5